MRILLDGRDDVFMVDGPTQFRELWQELTTLCEDSGRQIEKIIVDGKEITPSELDDLLDKDLSEFQTIEIETSGEDEQALEDLVQANSLILETMDLVEHFLNSGSLDYQDVVMSVINAMNTWERACRKIDAAARQLDVDYTKLKFGETDFPSQHNRSLEIINKLSSALSNQDMVSIRDILEYEFLPQIKTYSQLIKGIVKEKAERMRDEA